MVDPTRANILQAAKEAFYAQGYRVSMTDIAKRARVAKQTLYNHFDSKESLFAAVFRDGTADASARSVMAVGRDGMIIDRYRYNDDDLLNVCALENGFYLIFSRHTWLRLRDAVIVQPTYFLAVSNM